MTGTEVGKFRFTGSVDTLLSLQDSSRLPGAEMVNEPVTIDASGHVIFLGKHRGTGIFRETLRGDLTPELTCKCGHDPCRPQEHAGWSPR